MMRHTSLWRSTLLVAFLAGWSVTLLVGRRRLDYIVFWLSQTSKKLVWVWEGFNQPEHQWVRRSDLNASAMSCKVVCFGSSSDESATSAQRINAKSQEDKTICVNELLENGSTEEFILEVFQDVNAIVDLQKSDKQESLALERKRAFDLLLRLLLDKIKTKRSAFTTRMAFMNHIRNMLEVLSEKHNEKLCNAGKADLQRNVRDARIDELMMKIGVSANKIGLEKAATRAEKRRVRKAGKKEWPHSDAEPPREERCDKRLSGHAWSSFAPQYVALPSCSHTTNATNCAPWTFPTHVAHCDIRKVSV